MLRKTEAFLHNNVLTGHFLPRAGQSGKSPQRENMRKVLQKLQIRETERRKRGRQEIEGYERFIKEREFDRRREGN